MYKRQDRAYRALLEAKEAGKIKHIGITSHGLETVEKAVESGKFETIQFPYNIVENQADEVFKKAHEKGVGTIVCLLYTSHLLFFYNT